MDLLYGDPKARLTLGFNVARYNIGGGDDPSHTSMRADAQMEGFLDGPGMAFDWTRDAAQRPVEGRAWAIQEAFHLRVGPHARVAGIVAAADVVASNIEAKG